MSGFSKDIWTIFFLSETKTSTFIPNSDLKESVRAQQKLFILFLFLPGNNLLTGTDCKNLPHVYKYQILS